MCRYGLSYFYMRGAPAETLQRYKRLYDIQVLLAWPTEYLAAGTAVSSAETSRLCTPGLALSLCHPLLMVRTTVLVLTRAAHYCC